MVQQQLRVGARVQKRFGKRWYRGVLESIDVAEPYPYKVTYDDGDVETYNDDEWKSILAAETPSPRTARNSAAWRGATSPVATPTPPPRPNKRLRRVRASRDLDLLARGTSNHEQHEELPEATEMARLVLCEGHLVSTESTRALAAKVLLQRAEQYVLNAEGNTLVLRSVKCHGMFRDTRAAAKGRPRVARCAACRASFHNIARIHRHGADDVVQLRRSLRKESRKSRGLAKKVSKLAQKVEELKELAPQHLQEDKLLYDLARALPNINDTTRAVLSEFAERWCQPRKSAWRLRSRLALEALAAAGLQPSGRSMWRVLSQFLPLPRLTTLDRRMEQLGLLATVEKRWGWAASSLDHVAKELQQAPPKGRILLIAEDATSCFATLGKHDGTGRFTGDANVPGAGNMRDKWQAFYLTALTRLRATATQTSIAKGIAMVRQASTECHGNLVQKLSELAQRVAATEAQLAGQAHHATVLKLSRLLIDQSTLEEAVAAKHTMDALPVDAEKARIVTRKVLDVLVDAHREAANHVHLVTFAVLGRAPQAVLRFASNGMKRQDLARLFHEGVAHRLTLNEDALRSVWVISKTDGESASLRTLASRSLDAEVATQLGSFAGTRAERLASAAEWVREVDEEEHMHAHKHEHPKDAREPLPAVAVIIDGCTGRSALCTAPWVRVLAWGWPHCLRAPAREFVREDGASLRRVDTIIVDAFSAALPSHDILRDAALLRSRLLEIVVEHTLGEEDWFADGQAARKAQRLAAAAQSPTATKRGPDELMADIMRWLARVRRKRVTRRWLDHGAWWPSNEVAQPMMCDHVTCVEHNVKNILQRLAKHVKKVSTARPVYGPMPNPLAVLHEREEFWRHRRMLEVVRSLPPEDSLAVRAALVGAGDAQHTDLHRGVAECPVLQRSLVDAGLLREFAALGVIADVSAAVLDMGLPPELRRQFTRSAQTLACAALGNELRHPAVRARNRVALHGQLMMMLAHAEVVLDVHRRFDGDLPCRADWHLGTNVELEHRFASIDRHSLARGNADAANLALHRSEAVHGAVSKLKVNLRLSRKYSTSTTSPADDKEWYSASGLRMFAHMWVLDRALVSFEAEPHEKEALDQKKEQHIAARRAGKGKDATTRTWHRVFV